jgi:putative ABC transport system substrate-binding protein
VGFTGSAYALQAATKSVPIVFTLIFDAVDTKLVDSLSKPGGNLTGVSVSTFSLVKKRLQLLTQIVPSVSRVALLISAVDMGAAQFRKAGFEIAKEMGLALQVFEASQASDFEPLFDRMKSTGCEALVLASSAFFFYSREALLALANARRMPTCVWSKEMLAAGALMYYGADLADMVRRAAPYAVKILKGAKPSDLPVEEPTTYRFGVNMKTARAIGIEIPAQVSMLLDEVIE